MTAAAPLSQPTDLDRALELASEPPCPVMSGKWVGRASCRGMSSRYLGDDPISEVDRARCRSCPVRIECLVEGLRFGFEGLLAESVDDLSFHYGGADPGERFDFLGTLRAHAAARGVGLFERSEVVGRRVCDYLRSGESAPEVAERLDLTVSDVVDLAVRRLARKGWSNRRIAEVLGVVSYKTVERKRRRMVSASGSPEEESDCAA